MRLSSSDQKLIHNTAEQCFGSASRIYLFGSRTDDQKRGGDIDLYVETSLKGMALQEARLKLMTKLQIQMGDQKIDVVTADHGAFLEKKKNDEPLILSEIRKTGILL